MSGQLGLADGALVHGGVAAEVRQALANMAALLANEVEHLSQPISISPSSALSGSGFR